MSATITLTGDNQVSGVVDALTQGAALEQHPEGERARITADLRKIQGVFEGARQAAREAASSRELTPVGTTAAIERALGSAEAALAPFDTVATRLAETASATRRKALEIPAAERTPEAIAREREIRDRLAGEDGLRVASLYWQAIASGDWELVRAVEGAPRAFELIDAEARERGEAAKIERSPLAERLSQESAEADAYRLAVATARAALRKLRERGPWSL